ncbi:MAG TPA: hypothetical protein VMV92_05180 [Streptosporangiaceae bacterium]|nr:hypothetical protein [Streptosporangiaceae bacterium]
MPESWPVDVCRVAQDLGQGVRGGLGIGLQGGEQRAEVHAFGVLCNADHLLKGARQVSAADALAEFPGQRGACVGEVVGHAGELTDEGGGEPVGALRRRISPGPSPADRRCAIANSRLLGRRA